MKQMENESIKKVQTNKKYLVKKAHTNRNYQKIKMKKELTPKEPYILVK